MTNQLSLNSAACPFLSGSREGYHNFVGKINIELSKIGTQILEHNAEEITIESSSTFLTGTDLTYSGGRGSSAMRIGVTFSGLGGIHGIYVLVNSSGAQVSAGYGVIGIKCVVVNTAGLTNGIVYAAQFIAKHNHATNIMTAQASLIGVEAWAYISADGPARTVIGANFAIHNECTGAIGSGSVHRVVQVICDLASGAQAPTEGSGICIWNMTGAWDNAINIVNSSTGFTNFVKFTNDGKPAQSTGAVSGSQAGWIKVLVGSATCYIPLYPSVT